MTSLPTVAIAAVATYITATFIFEWLATVWAFFAGGLFYRHVVVTQGFFDSSGYCIRAG